ncbi:unnamed protein product [Adineta steineri]|uniref:BZIP domain-containing protein n=1 Tax=Adineta steineri TaxID=433720 RepID=A0A814Y4M4_9BILA|nr:unnamed protein product [Adineta steineri]CAF1224773.1 unnamed protein product [Adineta steineri]
MQANHHKRPSITNTIEYGPIKIRQNRKPAPTIATGRRPKSLVLDGNEAIKREQRREKNREVARKLKEKRKLFEEQLDQQLKDLVEENFNLQNYLQQLENKKQILQQEINNLSTDPLDELSSYTTEDIVLFFEEYSNEPDTHNKSAIEIIHDLNLNIISNSVKHN